MLGLHIAVGKIAAPTSGHQYFFADFVRFLQHQHAPTTLGGSNCTQQTGGTCTQNNDIVVVGSVVRHVEGDELSSRISSSMTRK